MLNFCLTPQPQRANPNPVITNLLEGYTDAKLKSSTKLQDEEIGHIKPEKIFAFDFHYDYKCKSTDMCGSTNQLIVSTQDSIILVPPSDYKSVHTVYEDPLAKIGAVRCLEENLIAFGSKDAIVVFDLDAQKTIRLFKLKGTGMASHTVIEPTSKTHNIFAGSSNGLVHTIDLSCKNALISQSRFFDSCVMDIKYKDGHMACCGLQESIKVFDIRAEASLLKRHIELEYVSSIAWVSQSAIAYPKAYDNMIEVFDIFSNTTKTIRSRGSSMALSVIADCREFVNFPSWNGIGYFEIHRFSGGEWKCRTFSFEDSIVVYGHVYNDKSKLVVFDYTKEMFVFDTKTIFDSKSVCK